MKRIMTAILILVTLLYMAACQATPEEDIIVQKDTERMVEKAADENNGTQLDTLVIPEEHYTYESTGADGKLHINVDAVIEKPDSGNMPIVRASIGRFSQEAVTGIFNYLFPDEKPREITVYSDKESLEQRIIEMKKALADGSYADQEMTKEEYENLLAKMEKQYQDVLSATPGPVSDGTLTKITKADFEFYSLNVATETKSLMVDTRGSDSSSENIVSSCSVMYNDSSAPVYGLRNMTKTDGTNIPDEAKDKLTISYADTKALCDNFFSAAGMADDFAVGASFVVADRNTSAPGEPYEDPVPAGTYKDGKYVETPREPAKNYAYRFYYVRKADGIPLAVSFQSEGKIDEESFAVPWYYEYACLTVDNTGLVAVDWNAPVQVGEVVQENASLKSFDEIIRIFQTMIKTKYEAKINIEYNEQARMDINVEGIQLCLLRVREQNGDQTAGLLVPAWVFYGHSVAIEDSSNAVSFDKVGDWSTAWPEAPDMLLAINAVDGSIIDIAKGY